jgi:cyclopropane fatty-acyl-phospholipid synthase-like methyltransferase
MKQDVWQFWYPRKEGTFEPEVPKLAQLLTGNHTSKLLDFGCGAGRHTVYFAQRGFQVYGFDKSVAAVEQAMRALEREELHADLRVWNMTHRLPYEGSFFDAVIATRVIHHTYTKNIKKISEEINRVLRTEGYLFLQVPAYRRQDRREKREDRTVTEVELRTYIASEGEEKDIPHHEFTKKELKQLFSNYTTVMIHRRTDHYRGWCWLAQKHRNNC